MMSFLSFYLFYHDGIHQVRQHFILLMKYFLNSVQLWYYNGGGNVVTTATASFIPWLSFFICFWTFGVTNNASIREGLIVMNESSFLWQYCWLWCYWYWYWYCKLQSRRMRSQSNDILCCCRCHATLSLSWWYYRMANHLRYYKFRFFYLFQVMLLYYISESVYVDLC